MHNNANKMKVKPGFRYVECETSYNGTQESVSTEFLLPKVEKVVFQL